MELFKLIIVFVLGTAVGSFTGVVVERESQTENSKFEIRNSKLIQKLLPSWSVGRSKCGRCGRTIAWYDNIPLVSFVILRGRCRWCHSPIPWRCLGIELFMGLMFGWAYLGLPRSQDIGLISLIRQMSPMWSGMISGGVLDLVADGYVRLALIFVFFWAMVSVALTDLRSYLIPDSVLVVSGLVGVISLISQMGLAGLMGNLIWGLVIAGFFAFLIVVTRGRGMGWGDAKLGFWMGLWLGWQGVVGLWLAFLTGALAGIILILSKKKRWGQVVPFGPFLCWGSLVAAFAGGWIVERVLSLGAGLR